MEAGISKQREPMVRANNQIKVETVRVIGSDGEMIGVLSTREAINIAKNEGLDLIEISPQAKPPVCKIMDYGKFKYEQSKKQNQAKKNQVKIEIKEIKLRPNIEINDYNTKLKHIKQFIEKGNKVKVTIRFRGREMSHNELGMKLLQRVIADTAELAKVDNKPKMEGRQMGMLLSPEKKA
ncbi:MAG: translation initiation factor IF-3 [Alphaproteobacteria bacterium]|jgi:translation initiation factor IF-3|nr:translation initiation factor IF-3 [Alphaproteobacteria bacterium]MCV6599194.1 translation initiation factor IF-3 [Alphaproteobacteria bacterium]